MNYWEILQFYRKEKGKDFYLNGLDLGGDSVHRARDSAERTGPGPVAQPRRGGEWRRRKRSPRVHLRRGETASEEVVST